LPIENDAVGADIAHHVSEGSFPQIRREAVGLIVPEGIHDSGAIVINMIEQIVILEKIAVYFFCSVRPRSAPWCLTDS
jgi:hypothetical protein